MSTSWSRGLVGLFALGLAAVFALGMRPSAAQVESRVGYLDRDLIVDRHAGTQIAAVLAARDRLQAAFDEEAKELGDAEKRDLFAQYEERLRRFEEEVGLAERMREIDGAIAEAAAESGVGIVIDRSAVVWGGVDLTEAVLEKLGAAD